MGEKLKESWQVILFTAFVSVAASLTMNSACSAIKKNTESVTEQKLEEEKEKIIKTSKEYTDMRVDNLKMNIQIVTNNIENDVTEIKESQVRVENYLIDILKRMPK